MDDRQPPDPAAGSPAMDFSAPYAPVVARLATVPLRPLAVTVISVLCILGGIVGILFGLMGAVNLIFGEYLANAFAPANGSTASAQQQMQQAMQAVNRQFLIPNAIILLAQLVISGCLLVGGIGMLRDKRAAVALTARTLLAAIVFEIARGCLYAIVQWKTYPIMTAYMRQLTEDVKGGGAMMGQITSAAMIAGAISWALWSIVKIVLMAWARAYLRRPVVDNYFSAVNPTESPHVEGTLP